MHNSKDIADAVAGCIWNCANSKNIVNIAKLSRAVLNPYSIPSQLNSKNDDVLKSLEMMEFERMKNRYASGLFKGL